MVSLGPVHGLPAKKISDAHFKEATRTLSNSLQTLSPFNKGLGVAIQKLDDSPATGDTLVTVELERTPMHPKVRSFPCLLEPRGCRLCRPGII